MQCLACGHPVNGAFCSRCGMRVPPVRPVPPPAVIPFRAKPRVPRHLQALGILWCLFGVYRAIEAVFATLFLMGVSSRWAFSRFGPIRLVPFIHYNPWLRGAAPFVAIITIAGAVAALAVGFGLLRRKAWARGLAMVIGILVLIRVPIGTALGIYTLWVLAPAASGAEYDTLTDN